MVSAKTHRVRAGGFLGKTLETQLQGRQEVALTEWRKVPEELGIGHKSHWTGGAENCQTDTDGQPRCQDLVALSKRGRRLECPRADNACTLRPL